MPCLCLAGALIPALFLGANAAEAAFPGEIRKADRESYPHGLALKLSPLCVAPSLLTFSCVAAPFLSESAIGVSRVEIPAKGEGAPGAKIPSVPLDTSGWEVASVSEAKPSKNGFWGGGESQQEKDALINRKAEAPFNRMLAGRTGGAPALTTP